MCPQIKNSIFNPTENNALKLNTYLVYDFDKDVVLVEVVLVSIAEAESIPDDLSDSKEDWVWPKVLADHGKLHLVLLPRVLQLDL